MTWPKLRGLNQNPTAASGKHGWPVWVDSAIERPLLAASLFRPPLAGTGYSRGSSLTLNHGRLSPMKTKSMKLPGPDHPITIEANPARVMVSVAGRIVADTRRALTLKEASYRPVQYIPRKDVDMTLLETSHHRTYCPYKGDCTYYSIP